MLQRISLRERGKERWKEGKKETRGPKPLWSKGVLFNIVWVYSAKIKIKSPDLQIIKET